MKILHVSTPLSWRGGEQQIAYLTQGLSAMRVDQIVLCPQSSPLATHLIQEEFPVATFETRGILDFRLGKKIKQLCKSANIDIVHCHDSHAHSGAVIAALLYGNKVPVVVSRRVDFPVSRNIFSRWKYNHQSVHCIICVSDTIRRITAPAIRDTSKLAVVHSGIDLEKYNHSHSSNLLHHELQLPEAAWIVGNLSALADHKDYPTFLRVAKKVIMIDPSVHFVIAGKGHEEAKIKKMISDLHLQSNVHLLGFRTDVTEVMQSLDIFLITSVTEGLGTIVLEAFAAGKPVVATRAGGIPEMVTHEVTGLLADPRDADQLSLEVLRLIADPDIRKKLTLTAKDRLEDFSYLTTARKTLDIYNKIAGG